MMRLASVVIHIVFIVRWWRRWDCGRSGSSASSMWTVKVTVLGSNSIRRSVLIYFHWILCRSHHTCTLFFLWLYLSLLFFFTLCRSLFSSSSHFICLSFIRVCFAVVWTLSRALFFFLNRLPLSLRPTHPSALTPLLLHCMCVWVRLRANPPHALQVCVWESGRGSRGYRKVLWKLLWAQMCMFVEALRPLDKCRAAWIICERPITHVPQT